jgi:hypothetical protein
MLTGVPEMPVAATGVSKTKSPSFAGTTTGSKPPFERTIDFTSPPLVSFRMNTCGIPGKVPGAAEMYATGSEVAAA